MLSIAPVPPVVESPISLAIDSSQFFSFLPLAYHTIILDGKRALYAFQRLLNLPETSDSFRRSLVIRLGIHYLRSAEGNSPIPEIQAVVNCCTSIQELCLPSWDRDVGGVLTKLSPRIQLRRLSLSITMAFFRSFSDSVPTSSLTHLQLGQAVLTRSSTPIDIPTLTHLVVRTSDRENLSSADACMQTIHQIIECAPASVKVLGIVFVMFDKETPYPLHAIAEHVLEMTHPSVVLGSFLTVDQPIATRLASTLFINGTKDLSWGPSDEYYRSTFIRWTREDIWDVIKTMLANRRES